MGRGFSRMAMANLDPGRRGFCCVRVVTRMCGSGDMQADPGFAGTGFRRGGWVFGKGFLERHVPELRYTHAAGGNKISAGIFPSTGSTSKENFVPHVQRIFRFMIRVWG